MKKLKYLILALLLVLLGQSAPKAVNANAAQSYVILFEPVGGISAQSAEEGYRQIVEAAGGEILSRMQNIPAMEISLDLEQAKVLKNQPGVLAVEPNIIFTIDAQTIGWGIGATNVQQAWDRGLTGAGVKIAIIDTGIAPHPDLSIAGGADFVNDGKDSYLDENGHGTHVAGIAAGLNNTIGIVGAAPEASLYAVKVLGASGGGDLADVISGVDWCISNEMDVINMSLGTSTYSAALEAALDEAYASGIIVAASAGNYGDNPNSVEDTVTYPGRLDSVIGVSAINSSRLITDFSSIGPSVDIAAPGKDIYSTSLNQGYKTMDGTSMSAPYVSGILALYKEAYPTAVPAELFQMLAANALDLGAPGKDVLYGYGLAQAPSIQSSLAEIISYSLPGQIAEATINSSAGTISLTLPAGSSLTALKADFTTSANIQSIKVGGVSQISGTTVNDFSSPVTYRITAEDGTVKDWVVSVELEQLELKTDIAEGYYRMTNVYSGKALGIYSISYADGASVTQYAAETASNQTLYFKKNSDGSYMIRFLHSRKMLDQGVADNRVLQWTEHGEDNQRWYVYRDGAGKLYIKNKQTGDFLSLASTADNAKPVLIDSPVIGDSRFQFTLASIASLPATPYVAEIEDGRYAVRSKSNGLYLDIAGGSSDNGAAMIIWPGHFNLNQLYDVSNTTSGTMIRAAHSGLALDVYGASSVSGAAIIQWTPHGNANQLWNFKRNADDGSLTIISKMSGLVLDVYGGYSSPGTKIIQWPSHGGDNQRWFFEKK